MIGRRVAGFDWHWWEPGDYGFMADEERWHGCTPNGEPANLASHTVVEHEDGTITVSPSILVTTTRHRAVLELWHGFLERGVWRTA